jgi:(p)ppGpp synthase/HD superfamily hydrolase
MSSFEEDKLYIRGWLSGAGMYTGLKAVNLGLEWHDGTRKDGVTPEFSHQLSQIQHVRTLAGVAFMEHTICTIALHDLPEDRRYDIKWVIDEFGPIVGRSVERMSKKYFGKQAEKSSENYYYELALDPNASIAKGCDRVHNQSSMPGVFTRAKMEEFMQETEAYTLPMLKEARKNHPFQESAYSGLRTRLKEQIHLIRTCVDIANNPGMVDVDDWQPPR